MVIRQLPTEPGTPAAGAAAHAANETTPDGAGAGAHAHLAPARLAPALETAEPPGTPAPADAALPGAPDLPPDVEDPSAPVTPSTRVYAAILGVPFLGMTGLVLLNIEHAVFHAAGAARPWGIGVPVLVWVGFVGTSGELARRQLLERGGTSAWRRWVGRPHTFDPSAADPGYRVAPMVTAAAVGFVVVTLMLGAGRWLETHVKVTTGGGLAAANIVGVVGSLGVGVLAGAGSALCSLYLLGLYFAYWGARRRARLRAIAVVDKAAGWAMRDAAYVLTDPWDEDTQAERRRRVWRRLELAATLAGFGGPSPELRRQRRVVAAALRTLAEAVYNTGDPARECVRQALVEAAPAVAKGAGFADAMVILQAAADEAGVAARRAAYPPPARRSPALVPALTLAGLLLFGLFAWAVWWKFTAPAQPGSVGAPEASAVTSAFTTVAGQVLGGGVTIVGIGVAVSLVKFSEQWALRFPLLSAVARAVGEHYHPTAGSKYEKDDADGGTGKNGNGGDA